MGLDYFDKIFYINLDHRKDRKKAILEQLSKFNVRDDKIIRIEAAFDELNGHRGCAQSHINALDVAIKEDLNNVLILEDDCIFLQSPNTTDQLLKYFFENISNWDVFLLVANIYKEQNTKHKMINKVLKASQTHSYAVNKDYMKILKKCFEEALNLLKQEMFFYGLKTLSRSINDAGWGIFLNCLKNKAQEYGKTLHEVTSLLASTRKCSKCGNKKEMSLNQREYICECGNSLDRDLNAAINIKNLAVGASV